MIFGSCPVCQSQVPQDRIEKNLIICKSCGWSDNKTAKAANKKTEKTFILLAVFTTILLIGGFIQIVNWNSYSLEIIPIKYKQIAGIATSKDLNRIAEICMDRQKPQCVEQAYADILRNDSENLEVIAKYAKILVNNKKLRQASNSFANYFKRGGKDLNTAFAYAKVLGSLGLIDESKEYFEYVINSKPGMMQITVTQRFVDMLYNAGRYREAQQAILKFRKRGVNATYFMEAKLKKIKKMLGNRG